jgi:hypothetical protein
MDRRQFLKDAARVGSAALLAPSLLKGVEFAGASGSAQVAFVKTADRTTGVARAIDLLELPRFGGKDLFVKPNFNSADPPLVPPIPTLSLRCFAN